MLSLNIEFLKNYISQVKSKFDNLSFMQLSGQDSDILLHAFFDENNTTLGFNPKNQNFIFNQDGAEPITFNEGQLNDFLMAYKAHYQSFEDTRVVDSEEFEDNFSYKALNYVYQLQQSLPNIDFDFIIDREENQRTGDHKNLAYNPHYQELRYNFNGETIMSRFINTNLKQAINGYTGHALTNKIPQPA